jgi:UDP-glucose 4-epimerase
MLILDSSLGHDPETHLIPLVLDAAAGVRPEIVVYGDDYDTPDCTCIHISDLSDVHVLALKALEAGAGTTAHYLGNGRGFSVKQVIDTARAVTGRDIPVRLGPCQPCGPPRLVGDDTRIQKELNWQPAMPTWAT